MAASQEKITVYNLADLKNTSDDAIANYLNSLKFRQSHRLTDVRLALGYSALALAAACFAWDYKLGFASTKHLTAAAVALYTLLNGALTLWMLRVERATVYVGTAPATSSNNNKPDPGGAAGGETVRISTSTKKNTPVYHVTVEVTTDRGSGEEKKKQTMTTVQISRPFSEWFDGAGRFVAAPFQSMLASAVPAIGRLDPKRVVADNGGKGGGQKQQQVASAAYSPEMLDMLAKANVSVGGSAAEVAAGTGSGAEAAGKKGGKRRKA